MAQFCCTSLAWMNPRSSSVLFVIVAEVASVLMIALPHALAITCGGRQAGERAGKRERASEAAASGGGGAGCKTRVRRKLAPG